MTRPEQSQQILQTLAASHPDFTVFQKEYTAPDATALNTEQSAELPTELLDDTLAALKEDPQHATAIDAISQATASHKSFISGGEIATLIAVAFLLRTHIKLERTATGKWKFLIEHKPSDSKLLTSLLKKLEDWLGGDTP